MKKWLRYVKNEIQHHLNHGHVHSHEIDHKINNTRGTVLEVTYFV